MMRYHATVNIEVEADDEAAAEKIANEVAQAAERDFKWAHLSAVIDDIEEAV